MNTLQNIVEDVKDAVRQAGGRGERRTTTQAVEALNERRGELAARLARQQQDLRQVRREVGLLGERRSSGGFPWGLVLAGGMYALYRSNPSFRSPVRGLLRRADPGVLGNLVRAGDAAREAVSRVVHGKDPGGALRAAGGELRRAGEKALDQAQDRLQDLNRGADRGAAG